MQGHPLSYRPGPWVALAGRDAARTVVLLAELDPAGPVLAALWEAVERGSGVDGLLGVIVREGLRSVPSFAIVEQADGARVVVSGKARAEVTVGSAAEPTVLAAAEAPTWTDRWIEGADGVRLSGEPGSDDGGPPLPLHSGAVLAAAVAIGAVADVKGETLRAVPPAEPQAPSAPPAAPQPVPSAPPAAPQPAQSAGPAVSGAPTLVPVGEQAAAEPAPPSFDHLFGPTDNPPVPPSEARTETPEAAGTTMYPPPQEDAGLIEALPWKLPDDFRFAPQPPAPVPAPAPAAPPAATQPPAPAPAFAPAPGHQPPPSGEPGWHTVDRSRITPPPEQTGPPAPTVLAAVCPNRHLGPPHAGVCRVCGQPVPQQDPISVPRPVLGVLNLSTGDMVPLDRDIVFGRAPTVTDTEPSIKPHLVQLASAANDISRSHLRISLEGWHVQAVDLGSTNGTIVTLPGQRPLRLRPHDPFTIVPGTVVSLADEVSLRYEVTG